MTAINYCSRINAPTIRMIEDRELLDQISIEAELGYSKKHMRSKHKLDWRQLEIILNYLRLKGGLPIE